jgi:O-antigen biosynthesis protein
LTPHRNAGAPRLIDWTGERCVPWTSDVAVIYEHYHRYLWAAQIARGRRVLDLGSGEGFGAAIMADVAAEIVGIDVDQTAVEHSRLNYARPGLSFAVGSATDLSQFEAGTFDLVVAFEVIEHLAEQKKVLAELRRVLREDGKLIISTPDRLAYANSSENKNPFHVRELSLDEFDSLLRTQFEYLSLFGQAMVEGSQINALDVHSGGPIDQRTINFILARAGEDWNLAPAFSPTYVLAMASNVPFEAPPPSTLADPEHTLLSDTEREVRVDRADLVGQIEELKDRLTAKDSELVIARQRIDEIDNSVAIGVVQGLSTRFYRVVPKDSPIGRLVQATLRLIGRAILRREM